LKYVTYALTVYTHICRLLYFYMLVYAV